MKKIIRFDTVRMIDNIQLLGVDIINHSEWKGNGRTYPKNMVLSSRSVVTNEHSELFLILFNKWKFLIKKIIK